MTKKRKLETWEDFRETLHGSEDCIKSTREFVIRQYEEGNLRPILQDLMNDMKAPRVKPKKKLAILYLMNDLIINNKEIRKRFKTQVQEIVRHSKDIRDYQRKVLKVVKIWKDKGLYSKQEMIDMKV